MRKSKKLLLIIDFKPRLRRTFEDWLISMAESLGHRGIDLVVLLSGDPVRWFAEEFGKVGRFIVAPEMRGRFDFKRARKIVSEERPDFLCFCFYPMLNWRLLALTRLPFVRASFFVDQSSQPIAKKRGVKGMLARLRGALGSRCYRKIITVSEFNQKKITQRLFLNPEKVVLAYNGVHTEQFSDRRLQEPRDSDRRDPYLLFVGSLEEFKGAHTLLEAYRIFHAQVPDPPALRFAGGGNLEGYLHERIDEYGLQNSVTLLGLRNDVPDLLCDAQAIVIPSEWDEACAFTAIESMCAGRPLFVSDAGSLPELVQPQGYVFEKGNAQALAAKLLEWHAVRNEDETRARFDAMADRARRTFSFEAMVNRYTEIFAE